MNILKPNEKLKVQKYQAKSKKYISSKSDRKIKARVIFLTSSISVRVFICSSSGFCWKNCSSVSSRRQAKWRQSWIVQEYHCHVSYSLKPGSDGRQEILSRRDFHSFSPLVAATRDKNEWKSRRDKLSCLPSEPGLQGCFKAFLKINLTSSGSLYSLM